MSKDKGHSVSSVDGVMLPDEAPSVRAFSPAVSFGLSVFETVRGYRRDDGRGLNLFQLEAHLDRLVSSARTLYFDAVPPKERVRDYILSTVRALPTDDDCHVRIAAFLDNEDGRLVSPSTTRIAVKASGRPAKPLEQSVTHCAISKWQRAGAGVMPGSAKCAANYTVARLALCEASARGFDDAILLSDSGSVAEGAVASLFAVFDGRLVTPPLSTNILPGLTRAALLHLAAEEAGLSVREADIAPADLLTADEVFLCSTGQGIQPIGQIEGRDFKPVPGPVTRLLGDLYERTVRQSAFDGGQWHFPLEA